MEMLRPAYWRPTRLGRHAKMPGYSTFSEKMAREKIVYTSFHVTEHDRCFIIIGLSVILSISCNEIICTNSNGRIKAFDS